MFDSTLEFKNYNSRQSMDKAQLISRHTTLGAWDSTKATQILVHGFLDSVNNTWWPPDMRDAFLKAVSILRFPMCQVFSVTTLQLYNLYLLISFIYSIDVLHSFIRVFMNYL